MPAIGHVTKLATGGYKGQVKTLSIRAEIDIVPNSSKSGDTQPDFRVLTQGVEIGAGWIRTGETSGKSYVSLLARRPRVRPPQALRQSRPRRRTGRSGRLRPDLEPGRLSPRARRPRTSRGRLSRRQIAAPADRAAAPSAPP